MMTLRMGKTLVEMSAVGCEDCGGTHAEGWSEDGRLILVVVAGHHAMASLPLCLECARNRKRGEFTGLTPAHSDRPLGGRLG
jgi:hypothetical protein